MKLLLFILSNMSIRLRFICNFCWGMHQSNLFWVITNQNRLKKWKHFEINNCLVNLYRHYLESCSTSINSEISNEFFSFARKVKCIIFFTILEHLDNLVMWEFNTFYFCNGLIVEIYLIPCNKANHREINNLHYLTYRDIPCINADFLYNLIRLQPYLFKIKQILITILWKCEPFIHHVYVG